MNQAKLNIERFDQQLDLLGDGITPAFELLGRRNENGIAQRYVLRDIEKLDLAVVNPCLNGKLPAAQMAFHEQRIFFRWNVVNFLKRTDHSMAEATSLVKRLDVNGVVRVAIQFQQGLVDTLHETDDVVFLVGLLEDPDPNAAKLGTALHQSLVTEQNRLPVHARAVQEH